MSSLEAYRTSKRTIELFLNEGTLKDLIISHLHSIGVIRDSEEVTDLQYGPVKDGLRTLQVSFEPAIHKINL